jgi:phage-related baseplate assembly protein
MNEFNPINFVDADPQSIQNQLIQAFQNKTGITLYPGDPRRVFLLQLIPVILALKNDINFTGNQNLLPFASDDVLDALGGRMGVPRLAEQPAQVVMQFTLSAIQINTVIIPKGTLVTPDGVLYFATENDLYIPSGETTGSIVATSTEGGEKYNDFVPGQINILVQPIAFVKSVTNINISAGGSNQESNDAYRERQRLAPSTFSVAGPKDAYVFFAKSADVNIVDVAVDSPAPSQVNIYPLLKNGGLPNQNLLDKVYAEVSPKNRRPLTDKVSVLAPTAINYDINVTYYISSERSTEVATIRSAIEDTGGAIDQYVAWQNAKLERAITPDNLQSRMYMAGAYRVVVTSPIYTEINPNEFGTLNLKTITYGGVI